MLLPYAGKASANSVSGNETPAQATYNIWEACKWEQRKTAYPKSMCLKVINNTKKVLSKMCSMLPPLQGVCLITWKGRFRFWTLRLFGALDLKVAIQKKSIPKQELVVLSPSFLHPWHPPTLERSCIHQDTPICRLQFIYTSPLISGTCFPLGPRGVHTWGRSAPSNMDPGKGPHSPGSGLTAIWEGNPWGMRTQSVEEKWTASCPKGSPVREARSGSPLPGS